MSNFTTSKDKVPALSKGEIEFLLQYIAATAFKGENVKVLYNIVDKLEKQLHG